MGNYIENDYSPQELGYVNGVLDEVQKRLPEITEQLIPVFKTGFGQQAGIEEKTPGDFVTPADKEIEQTFRDWIKQQYPSHSVCGEEQGGFQSEHLPEWLWAIDPIDGTSNYQAGNPDASIVLSLRYKGKPVFAVCNLPMKNDEGTLEYVAREGKGITKNGKLVQASSISDIKYATAVMTHLTIPQRMMTMVGDMWDKVAGTHMNMSSVYESCRVASGEVNIGVFYDMGIYEWPAMYLFAKEAGCIIGPLEDPDKKVNLYEMGSKNFLMANNQHVYDQIKQLVHIPPPLI